MQFTLFASLVFLCSLAFALPPQLRDSSLVDVDADVDNIANNLTAKVLSERDVGLNKRVALFIRDELVDVDADVDNIANNLTVKVLSERNEINLSKRSPDTLVDVDADVDNILNNATVKVISE